MPLAAVLLVLTSSVFHVAWNSLVKTSGDPLATATRAVGLGVLAVTPAAILAWLMTGRPTLAPEGWLIVVISGLVSAAYFVPLSAAYRRGALSSVYPVARGTGALLGVAIGVAILGEQLEPAGMVGVALLLGGTLAAASTVASRATVGPALLAGLLVAGYSALDRVGVRTGPPWLYAWILWSVCGLGLLAWGVAVARFRAGRAGPGAAVASGPGAHLVAAARTYSATIRADRREVLRSLLAGLLMIGTYMLILLAFAIAPLAGVAPLREATTILAAAWGVVVLGERERAGTRLAAASAVAVGAVLLAASG
ncbi:MAG: hypothetical protein MUC54_04690 [Chloroflexi bacterium]|nr:hypothetical protein [Chloroflexota bacterium]